MTRLVMIRHGEAQSHVDGILGGERFCNGLSEQGRRQAEALRDRFKASSELGEVGVMYASSLPRAVETAEIIAPALGHPEMRIDRDLREFDPGEADGLSWAEYQDKYPPPEVRDPYRPRTPGSESWAQFGERVEAALARIVQEHVDQTVVVACHGGVIEQAFHLWGLSVLNGLHLEVANTGITEFVWAEPLWHVNGPPGWRLVRHNDAAHLLNVL